MTARIQSQLYSTRVTAPAAFAGSPDVTIPFLPEEITVVNEDGTAANYVEVSFDGTNVHGPRLIPTQVAGLNYGVRATGVWLRRGAGTPAVTVMATARWKAR